MTLVPIRNGLIFPSGTMQGLIAAGTGGTMDAATEKVAFVGHIYLATGPGTSKTLSAAGGGSISYRAGATTFANGSTTLELGLQDISTSAGPPAQPDGTFDVSRVLTGGVATITSNAWNTFAMTGGSGSKTLTHGDLFAIVWDMTARGGADSVIVNAASPVQLGSSIAPTRPSVPVYIGSWAEAHGVPQAIIAFDDGTLGWIDGVVPFSTTVFESFSDSSTPDERGLIFQVPMDCTVDALFAVFGINTSASDFTAILYSAPLTSPSALATVTGLAEQIGTGGLSVRLTTFTLAAEVSLTKATDYCLAFKATSTGSIGLAGVLLGNEAYRVYWPAGTTMAKATRNNGSGAFSAESPAISIYQMGVRISQIHDGAGAGGGLLVHPGLVGGMRG